MAPAAEESLREAEQEDGAWVNAELLQEVLGEGATVLSIQKQRATGKGDNYLSILYRTRLEYRTRESGDSREKNLILKGLPQGEFMVNYIQEVGVFRREISMYDGMLPRLYAFADSTLGKGTFNKFSATFYKTSRPDTLILEDLKTEGFLMASRRDRLDLAHSKLVVQNLARLHALSVAYNESNPGSIAEYPDTFFIETQRERLNQFVPTMIKSLTEEITKWEGYSKITNSLKALQDTFVTKIIEVCNVAKCPRTVLVHGDAWVNNILFKYSETEQPVDLRFVDFQLSREGSPALDLNYFLFTSLRTDVRERHFENLLQEYCDEFGSFAKQLGYSGAIFTYDEIHREMVRTAAFALMASTSIMPIVIADPNDSPDLDTLTEDDVERGDVDIYSKMFATTAFREAFKCLIPHFEECGVFD